MQRIASGLMLGAPALFALGFWIDPSRGIEDPTLAAPALYLTFLAGVLFVALGRPPA